MMKRFVGLMTVMTLLLGIFGATTVNVSAVPLNISGIFGYSSNSNMTQSVKFLSYEEFAAYAEENGADIQFETEMYDEGFFENNYLYLLHIRTDSSGSKFEHTSTVFNGNSIDFEITQTYHGVTDDVVSWFYILEADKNFVDTEVNLILTYDLSPKISYFHGYFGSVSEDEPQTEKINSLEESKAYGTYIASRYSESFFENNFLLTVSWQEPQAVRTHEVSSVIRHGNSINVELSEFPVDGYYPDVVTPYCAVIELPKSLADMECAVTRNNLIRIYTVQELAQLRDDVNNGNTYEGKHIILMCDIDLSSVCGADINGAEGSWTPIGAKDNHADEAYDIDITDNIFNGCFDGNGHTVSGLYINSDENADAGEADKNYFGLFGCTGEKSVIKNLTLDGSVAVSRTIRFGSVSDLKGVYTGALAGYNGGIIEDCHNNATVDAAATLMSVGGISGASVGEISRCSNNADISGISGVNAGGIAGKSTAEISKCSNYGNIIKVGRYTGGIAGRLEGAEAMVDNCCNLGDVSSSYLHGYGYEGGIAGYASDTVKVTNSYSVGTISGENGGAITALTALGSKLSAENCYYLENTAAFQLSDTTAKTASQFESGEVAYLLGSPWGQKIGVDKYPVIGGDKVYLADDGFLNAPAKVVTVEPPTVNIASGEVPYGSKVTISPTNGNDFAYSVNGEQFINSRLTNTSGNAVITITEDTVLVVRSMIDVVEPDTEYIFPEATYTYTIGGSVVPTEYPYTINSLKLVSESGEAYDTPPTDKSFIVEADIIKTEERNEKDYLFVAVYDTDGALISLDYVKAKFSVEGECSFGFSIPPQKKSVGSVKAFVWNTFNSMEPLAETKTLSFLSKL